MPSEPWSHPRRDLDLTSRDEPTRQITVTPLLVADLLVDDEPMPVHAHLIEHPDARILVDTGLTRSHPLVADLRPRPHPLVDQLDLATIDIVINTHLHFDHCGGNGQFPGVPIYVQRTELDDALTENDYTIREWVQSPVLSYVPVDGALDVLPGVRLVPAPGHTRGSQVVVVDNPGHRTVVGGDVAVWLGELEEAASEGPSIVHALDPDVVWLAHASAPWHGPCPGTDTDDQR